MMPPNPAPASATRALFASPSTSGGLPYPSYTPFPSRTVTPILKSSPSSSPHNSLIRGSTETSGNKKKKNKNAQIPPWKKQQSSPSISFDLAPHPRHQEKAVKMAYYGYYQQQAPNWASSQFEPLPPPMPTYHPSTNWRGYDYYQAHSGDTDHSLFDNIWGRFKSAIGSTTQGYSRQHAKQIYRRIYGGVVDLLDCSADELGAAAGYEAIRLWEYHHNLYQTPLNHDLDREREALGGLAIGEANKLWARADPYRTRRGRRTCAEVAMATAQRIFTFQYEQNAGVSSYLTPEQQMANRSVISNPGLIGGPYAAGGMMDPVYDQRPRSAYGTRSRSRRGSMSYYDAAPPPVSAIPLGGMGGPSTYQNINGYTVASAPPPIIPFPGEMSPGQMAYGPPMTPMTQGGYPVDDYVIPTGAPMSSASGGYGVPMGAPGSSYGPVYGTPMGYGAPASYGNGGYEGGQMLAAPGYRRQRSYSQGAYLPGY
ncbi:hypothetical protein FRC14_000916 [Serendipita sp. 396]|nr:hypothetical protein FRC14_000916 [Serendipita sp. 396]KAG8851188.1 hypothetical protein FRC20_001795 [Serendipita sp. 405]